MEPPASQSTTLDEQPKSKSARLLGGLFRVVALVTIALTFAVWIYAYSGLADRPDPDLFDTVALAQEANQICESTLENIDSLPRASEAEDGVVRAQQIREANGEYQRMVDELGTLATSTERDKTIVSGWLSDWNVLLNDRDQYAESLAAGANEAFLMSDLGVGERLDKRLNRIAATNRMPACALPTDV